MKIRQIDPILFDRNFALDLAELQELNITLRLKNFLYVYLISVLPIVNYVEIHCESS